MPKKKLAGPAKAAAGHKKSPAKKAGKGQKAASKTKSAHKSGTRATLLGLSHAKLKSTLIPAAEVIVAGGIASSIAAYRQSQGLDLKFGTPVDFRIVVGLALGGVGYYYFDKSWGSHAAFVGAGVVGSFLIEKAREYGAWMAKPAAPAADADADVKTTGVGAIKWPLGKAAKERRLERRLERLDKKEASVRNELREDDQGQGQHQRGGAQHPQRRKVLVIPQDGDYRIPKGRYQKIGALADY